MFDQGLKTLLLFSIDRIISLFFKDKLTISVKNYILA